MLFNCKTVSVRQNTLTHAVLSLYEALECVILRDGKSVSWETAFTLYHSLF